jgi:protein toll
LAGEWIPDQIVRSVASSKRTVVILTENFLDSFWGKVNTPELFKYQNLSL